MISVEVEDEAWREALPDVEAVVLRAAEAALPADQAGAAAGELTVLLADEASVRDLNARFRGKDTATNVLSFPAPETARPHLGDLALAYGVCTREAAEQGKTLEQHLTHLVAHGVLHLLGYDHMDESEAEAMEGRERAVMARLGWPDPYLLGEAAESHGRP